MFPQLYFAIALIASVELLFIGLVIGFFQEKISINDVAKLLISALIAFVFLYLGFFLGEYSTIWVGERSLWYSATIIFILGLKMFYDRIKLGKLKQLINPLEVKGLITLTALAGINFFFIGLAGGLQYTKATLVLSSVIVLAAFAFLGYALGFNLKKITSRRFEFLSGILYIVIAIIIASNI